MLKDRADQLDKWCERRTIRKNKGSKELLTYNRMKKGNCIGHIVRSNIIELKIDRKVKRTERRRRRGKQLLDDWREKDDNGIWKRKNEIDFSRKLAYERLRICRKRDYAMQEIILCTRLGIT
jgi:hypothetical protein